MPVDFILFALMLLGIALFQRHTLQVAVGGLVVVTIYKLTAGRCSSNRRTCWNHC